MSLLSISESTTNLEIKSLSLFENTESGRKSNLAAILFFLQIEHSFFTSTNIIRFKRKVKTLVARQKFRKIYRGSVWAIADFSGGCRTASAPLTMSGQAAKVEFAAPIQNSGESRITTNSRLISPFSRVQREAL